MAKQTLAEQIAQFVVNLKYNDIPQRVIHKAKEQVLGVIAAIYAGSQTVPGKIIFNTVKDWGDREEASLIPSGLKTSTRTAVLANSAIGVALDYVDYLLSGHTGISAVPISLAIGEKVESSGKEVLIAQIIANEVEGRLGTSVFVGPQNGQCWSYIHLIGGAVAAGRLLQLTEEQVTNAITVSLSQSTFPILRGFMGPHSKLLTTGIPAQLGVQAAYLAKNGFTGAADLIENPIGFCNMMADLPLKFIVTSALGDAWVTDTICYKLYPGCAYIDGMADCILKILEKTPSLNLDEIEEISVYSSILTSVMNDLAIPYADLNHITKERSHVALNFSLPYNAAVLLIDKELTPKQFTEDRIRDPHVHELAKKVKIINDISTSLDILEALPSINIPSLNDIISGKFSLKDANLEKVKVGFGAKVKIKMKNGTIYRAAQKTPFGTPGNYVPLEKKFRQEAVAINLPAQKIENTIKMVESFENISNIQNLLNEIVLS
ncbi:MAG TPA: MmgE/PrpD family protein [Candidatus Deferrimicrobium sp.]|nr:MmgE/PrpD family protein [Candidatus Deferrimicrobium sp.]